MNEASATEQGVLVIVEVSAVHDPDHFKAYQLAARKQIGVRGGVVVARGGSSVEGSPPFQTLRIQEWPSEAAFISWQESDQYRPLRSMRIKSATMRTAIVSASHASREPGHRLGNKPAHVCPPAARMAHERRLGAYTDRTAV